MDILIRDLPLEIIHAIDEQAQRLGVSRTEFVRRELTTVALRSRTEVTEADLLGFTERFTDLADPDVMARAWD